MFTNSELNFVRVCGCATVDRVKYFIGFFRLDKNTLMPLFLQQIFLSRMFFNFHS